MLNMLNEPMGHTICQLEGTLVIRKPITLKEKAMAPHSCLENSMDGEPGRLQSMGSLGVGHD